MGIIDKTATDGEDEVDMPEEPLPPEEEEKPAPSGPTSGPGAAPMNASYNHLLDMANSYIYM